jgi:hypothetical protein
VIKQQFTESTKGHSERAGNMHMVLNSFIFNLFILVLYINSGNNNSSNNNRLHCDNVNILFSVPEKIQ